MEANDQIRLVLPAAAEYGRIARIATAGLALRLGFTYREIEDLRLAIDETLILLLRPDDGGPGDEGRDGDGRGSVTVTFEPAPEQIVIEATASGRPAHPLRDAERRQRFATIVEPVVDDFSIDEEHDLVRLVKQRTPR